MPRYKQGTIRHGDFMGISYKEINFLTEYTKDFNARRAAVACGMQPEKGYAIVKKDYIANAIEMFLARRIEASDIDAEWVLMEAVDLVLISKERGKYSSAITALNLVAKHCMVDAYAADKIKIDTADDVVQRLKRARDRVLPDEPSFL